MKVTWRTSACGPPTSPTLPSAIPTTTAASPATSTTPAAAKSQLVQGPGQPQGLLNRLTRTSAWDGGLLSRLTQTSAWDAGLLSRLTETTAKAGVRVPQLVTALSRARVPSLSSENRSREVVEGKLSHALKVPVTKNCGGRVGLTDATPWASPHGPLSPLNPLPVCMRRRCFNQPTSLVIFRQRLPLLRLPCQCRSLGCRLQHLPLRNGFKVVLQVPLGTPRPLWSLRYCVPRGKQPRIVSRNLRCLCWERSKFRLQYTER